jgi:hypothetical protein
MIDGCGDSSFVAVGVEHLPDEIEIDPHSPQLLVGLAQTLEPPLREFRTDHVGLRLPLLKQTNAGLWNRTAQIHQMPDGAPSRKQRPCRTGQGVSHHHDVVAISAKGVADEIRVSIEVGRPVVTRQIGRDHIMTGSRQERSQLFPTPGAVPRTMHESERRHASSVKAMSPSEGENNNLSAD